jgi:predicted MPP superfamily phosphohydrolase
MHADHPSARRLITRRRLLAGLGVTIFTPTAMGGYARFIEPHWLQVVHMDMPLRGVPAAWDGRRIAHITDLHVGNLVDDDYLRAAIGRINDLHADMVVITGDVIDVGKGGTPAMGRDVLRDLAIPEHGVWVVLGNHDYGRGWREKRIADALAGELRGLGFHVLRNDLVDVNGLQLVGVDDLYSGQADREKALAGFDAMRDGLALVHNPDEVDQPAWKSFTGWILAGHTHGGQVRVPLLGPLILPIENRRFAAGLVDLATHRRLYVNCGVGYLRKVRFCVRPEVAVFTVRAVERDG